MGSALGQCALVAGQRVGWCTSGRSESTRLRAADFDAYPELMDLLDSSDIVISVCPPAAAMTTARAVARNGYTGYYIDANAVAPASADDIRHVVEDGGARFIDGGIIGPPPTSPGTTWLYVSGADAPRVAPCFSGSQLTVVNLGEQAGAASALKMCYAAWTKGSSALLLAVAAVARAAGVGDALESQWQQSNPDLPDRLLAAARRDAPKAWRFAGEMEQIAATFGSHNLPTGFHGSAAEIFAALADFRDPAIAPDLDAVLEALLANPVPDS